MQLHPRMVRKIVENVHSLSSNSRNLTQIVADLRKAIKLSQACLHTRFNMSLYVKYKITQKLNELFYHY